MRKLILIIAVCLSGSLAGFAQKVALKTNLLYDATSTINLGVEVALAPRWTLDVSGNFNAWDFEENRKMKHWLIQPEARWWTCSEFSGHFLGLHVLGGEFNFGGMLPFGFKNGKSFGVQNSGIYNNRYQGWIAGVGVSYGYHWILGNHWGLEATLGLGYAYMKYDKYECKNCGKKLGSELQHYFGPTKAGITLVYVIK